MSLYLNRETTHLSGDLSLNNITLKLMLHEFDSITWLFDNFSDIESFGTNSKKGESIISSILNFNDSFIKRCSH